MEWVKERDLLIEQTLAFVQSVNARKADIKRADIRRSDTNRLDTKPDLKLRIETAPIDAIKVVEPPESIPVARTIVSSDFRAEMQARVANFRAHQERFNREREEYFSTTLAKVRAALGEDSAPPPQRK